MFATKTKEKLAALEREAEILGNELQRQNGVVQAATELLSALKPEDASAGAAVESRLREAREGLSRLARSCEGGDAPGPGAPLLERLEGKLAAGDRAAAEASRRNAQVERLARALETALDALPEEILKGMVGSFPVYEHWEEAGGKAWVTTAFCQLGGCEYRGREFDTYREALAFAVVREAMGEGVQTSGACPECYAEYMRDCV